METSERCLKWGGGGGGDWKESLLKQLKGGKGRNCS